MSEPVVNPSDSWDEVPVYASWLIFGDQPDAGKVTFSVKQRINLVSGRSIYAGGAIRTVTIGDQSQQDPTVRSQVRAAMRAIDETKPGFNSTAWDVWWDTVYVPSAIFTSFPASDDPDIVQQGYQVMVKEQLGSGAGKEYAIQLSLSMLARPIPGENLGLVDVPPGSPTAPAPIYAKGMPGGVAPLDYQGKVPLENLPDDIGGGAASTWDELDGKPAAIAAGDTPQDARDAIGAVGTGDSRLGDARPPTPHQHAVEEIQDSTPIGRQVLMAGSAGAARAAIGAGTSNLVIGAGAGQAASGVQGAKADTAVQPAELAAALESQQPTYLVNNLVGGGIDETSKVQAAIDWAAPRGIPIILPPGTFRVRDLTIPSYGCQISGSSQGATILAPAPGAQWLLRTRSYCIIRDLQMFLDGQDIIGLDVRTTVRGLVDNLYIYSTGSANGGTGIRVSGTAAGAQSHANRLTNCMIQRVGIGIHGSAWCYDTEMLNIWVGEAATGIRFSDGGCMWTNVHVWGCTGNGITLFGVGGGNRFVNMYVETNQGYGMFADSTNATGNVFIGCRFWANKLGGLRVIRGKHAQILGCQFDDNEEVGLTLWDHTDAVVSGCAAYDTREGAARTQKRGIQSGGTSNRITIVGCNIDPAAHTTGEAYALVGTQNRVEANMFGTIDRHSFYGATPIAKQTGVPITAAGIHAALVNLGLIS